MISACLTAATSLALLSAAAGSAQTTVVTSAEEKKVDPDAVICKNTTVVNSRIPVRVCRTNAEWEAEKRAQLEENRSPRRSSGRCGDVARC